jgi:hypothetical protein
MAGTMETPNKFRFTLQWGNESVEKVQAGKLLKKLGNRKSEFIVMAITEYIASHPDLQIPANTIKVIVKPGISQEQIESIVRTMLDDRLSKTALVAKHDDNAENPASQSDIDEMINNLDMFLT